MVGEFGGVGVCVPRGGVGGDEQIRHPQGGGSSRILDEIRQRERGRKKTVFSRGCIKCMVPSHKWSFICTNVFSFSFNRGVFIKDMKYCFHESFQISCV